MFLTRCPTSESQGPYVGKLKARSSSIQRVAFVLSGQTRSFTDDVTRNSIRQNGTCWPPCSEQRDRLTSCQRAFPARRLPDGCEVASRFSRAHRGDTEHLEHSRLRVELAKLQDELMHVERGDGANETKAQLRAAKEMIFARLRNHST